MLTHLTVRNLAVIEEASVEFGSGLNVLTGETGAGKSILVDALALLSGARATSDLIRRGADRLTVAGIFRPRGSEWKAVLGEGGLQPQSNELVIRREVSRDGPNRVFMDDEPVTLRLLADVAPHLLRIHTQREELNLISPEFQRQLLDRSGGDEAARLLELTRSVYSEYHRGRQRLERLAGDQRARLERLDLLRFHLREIEGADITAGEEDAIRAERKVLRHSEAIRAALGESLDRLFERDGSAAEQLSASVRGLREVTDWEPAARGWIDELEEVRIRLEETSREIGHRLQEVEADPSRLNEIEERLDLL
jgi:DNA repair protein RecN (Recombination protein N)